MKTLILFLLTTAFLNAGQGSFEQGLTLLQQSGELAKAGKFVEANQSMAEAFTLMDNAVAENQNDLKLRIRRGMTYAQMPAFLGKAVTAKADLEFALKHPEIPAAVLEQVEKALGKLTSSARADRFPKVPATTSPIVAAASITFPNWTSASIPPSMNDLMKQLEGYPGLTGKHMVASMDKPGMFIILTWWKDKQALNDWFYGDLHQVWMKRNYNGKSSASSGDSPSQVAMEIFAGLEGGVQINGGLIPEAVFHGRSN